MHKICEFNSNGHSSKDLYELIENIPGVLWESFDSNAQRPEFVSGSLEDLLGYSVEEWFSDPSSFERNVHADDLYKIYEAKKNCIEKRSKVAIEFRIRRKNGTYLWVESRYSPVLSESGDPIGIRGFTYDISERHKAKEIEECRAELAANNAILLKQAQDALRVRDDFISMASHELKTPLTAIRLQNQLMAESLEKLEFPPESRKKLINLSQMTAKQLRHLERLVENMLDSSKLSAGKFNLDVETFDLNEVVREVLSRMAEQIKSACCEADVLLQDGLFGRWDRCRIDQVITNLLTNVLKYAPQKPFHVRTYLQKNQAVLSIRDQGIGIKSEDQDRIFDRFFQTRNSPSCTGMGLGLYIAREIIRQHGGQIQVESEFGVGSTFKIWLPLFAITAAI